MEVETQSANKLSSPHVDSPSDPQYAQSFVGDAQTVNWSQPNVDPCDPQYAQSSTIDTQTEKWSYSMRSSIE